MNTCAYICSIKVSSNVLIFTGAPEPEVEDELCAELTLDELKQAFRFNFKIHIFFFYFSFRLFNDTGDGFISVTRFRVRQEDCVKKI